MKLDLIEKQNLKIFLISVYGPQVNAWSIGDKMFDLTYALINDSRQCSDLMDLVPRPLPLGQQPAKWLTKEIRNIILRKLKDRKEHYSVCVKTSALKRKTQFIMAANGL